MPPQKLRDPQTFAIIGAAMEVHREFGGGFLEAVYRNAMLLELDCLGIPFRTEVVQPVFYKRQKLACLFRLDLICYDEVVVELKALPALSGRVAAQTINYLKASGLPRGLVLNFGSSSLQCRRLVNPGR